MVPKAVPDTVAEVAAGAVADDESVVAEDAIAEAAAIEAKASSALADKYMKYRQSGCAATATGAVAVVSSSPSDVKKASGSETVSAGVSEQVAATAPGVGVPLATQTNARQRVFRYQR